MDHPRRHRVTGYAVRVILTACTSALALPARAQQGTQPSVAMPARPVRSMGQPPRWQPYAAGLALFERGEDGATLLGGVYRPLMNPVMGLLGASGEFYRTYGARHDGSGARLLARSPMLALAAGADWNVSRDRV